MGQCVLVPPGVLVPLLYVAAVIVLELVGYSCCHCVASLSSSSTCGVGDNVGGNVGIRVRARASARSIQVTPVLPNLEASLCA